MFYWFFQRKYAKNENQKKKITNSQFNQLNQEILNYSIQECNSINWRIVFSNDYYILYVRKKKWKILRIPVISCTYKG